MVAIQWFQRAEEKVSSRTEAAANAKRKMISLYVVDIVARFLRLDWFSLSDHLDKRHVTYRTVITFPAFRLENIRVGVTLRIATDSP